jgi:hypothetical protein
VIFAESCDRSALSSSARNRSALIPFAMIDEQLHWAMWPNFKPFHIESILCPSFAITSEYGAAERVAHRESLGYSRSVFIRKIRRHRT